MSLSEVDGFAFYEFLQMKNYCLNMCTIFPLVFFKALRCERLRLEVPYIRAARDHMLARTNPELS